MKRDELHRNLIELAERLGVKYFEKNFRHAGIRVNSGLCRIEGEWHFYMDKHLKPREKTEILAHTVSKFPLDDMYIIPALRDYIERNRA